MLKHIIGLALCFMAYIIGNLGEVCPEERKAQFDRLVDCYDQMFQYGFVTGARPELTTFQDIKNFVYTNIRVQTIGVINGITVTDVNSPQFSNYLQLESLKQVFAKEFVPKGPQDIMKILEEIREKHKPKIIEHSDDAPETSDNNKKRKLNTNIHSDDAPEVSVDTLPGSSNYPEPLNTFIQHYDPNGDIEFLKSVSGFCARYSLPSPIRIENLKQDST